MDVRSKRCSSTSRSPSAKPETPLVRASSRITYSIRWRRSSCRPLSKKGLAESKPFDTFLEDVRRRQKADHDITAVFKIVKVSRLHQNVAIAKQTDLRAFLLLGNDSIPAGFHVK